jgi:hypothetical protein
VDVDGLRSYVRAQLDVDEEELPNSLLNIYLQEAFDRTMAFSNDWPRNEKTWELTKLEGEDSTILPADCNLPSIISIVSASNGYRLAVITQETAEDIFLTGNTSVHIGTPIYVSVWARQLQLWPNVDTDVEYNMIIRGYSQPVWTNGASDVPDLDPRLHVTLAYFAIALAYAQQEDEVLEAAYMNRWSRDLVQQLKSIRQPLHHRPLVMNAGQSFGGAPSFVIVPPT